MGCFFQNFTPPPPLQTWPLRVSENHRYLTTAGGSPFFIIGDSAQNIIQSLSVADLETTFANDEQKGVNARWCHLEGTWGPQLWGQPWTTADDISTPREAYFAHVDEFLNLAKARGICIFLDVTGDNGMGGGSNGACDTSFNANGSTKAYQYGSYLGSRYANQGNIVWVFGNDWHSSCYGSASNRLVVTEVARGITDNDTNHHLMTVELYPTPKLSTDGPSDLDAITDINSAYSYAPIYKTVRRGYERAAVVPVIGFEMCYEDRGDAYSIRHGYRGTPRILRSNQHWAILQGALCGVFYGHDATAGGADPGPMVHGDLPLLDSAGRGDLIHLRTVYASRRWYDLVPDFSHIIGTAGYGAFEPGTETNMDMGIVTATTVAATADGQLCIAYMERSRNLTINTSQLAAGLTWRWFNPADGGYTSAGGPFTGSHVFIPPTTRSGDWVLIGE